MTAASVALLALVLQLWAAVLLPAAAAFPKLEICTGDGIVHLPADGSGGPEPEHRHCDVCLVTVGGPPLPTAPTIEAVVFADALRAPAWTSPVPPPRRASRPPARGPPSA